MAIQLAPCGVLLPGPVQYCSQHSCIIAVGLLLQPFSQCQLCKLYKNLKVGREEKIRKNIKLSNERKSTKK